MDLRKPYGDKKIPNKVMAIRNNPTEKKILVPFIERVCMLVFFS